MERKVRMNDMNYNFILCLIFIFIYTVLLLSLVSVLTNYICILLKKNHHHIKNQMKITLTYIFIFAGLMYSNTIIIDNIMRYFGYL